MGGWGADFTERIDTDSQAAAYALNWAAYTYVELTITGDVTVSFSNLAAGRSVTLMVIQDGTGGHTITWPAITWLNGTPIQNTEANDVDVFTFFVESDGSTVQGFSATSATPGARVYHNTTQSISDNTNTKLVFNSERWDVGGFHDTVTNNERLTVPTGQGGTYLIGATIQFATGTFNYAQSYVLLNNSTAIDFVKEVSDGTNNQTMHIVHNVIYQLSAGDYVELYVRHQGSGGAVNVVSASAYTPEFWIHRLA